MVRARGLCYKPAYKDAENANPDLPRSEIKRIMEISDEAVKKLMGAWYTLLEDGQFTMDSI